MNKVIKIDYSEGEGLDKVEYKGEVTLKRLNFSEKNDLEEQSTDIKVFGNMPQVKVSTSKMKEIGLLKSVVDNKLTKTTYYEDKVTKNHNPVTEGYSLDITGIRNLPVDIGELLFNEFTDLNSVNEKKNVR